MTPPWNSAGLLGGPERRHLDRRGRDRSTLDRLRRRARRRARAILIATAMSAAPIAQPMISMLPTMQTAAPRVDVVTVFAVAQPGDIYEDIIRDAAAEYDLDAALIRAVVEAESRFDPSVVSKAGAKGLMQLMPDLADELGVTDSFDPRDNIMGGARYLKRLLNQYDGNIDHALAGYNAGPGNVERYGGVPPFKETKNYVKNIKRLLLQSKKRSDAD